MATIIRPHETERGTSPHPEVPPGIRIPDYPPADLKPAGWPRTAKWAVGIVLGVAAISGAAALAVVFDGGSGSSAEPVEVSAAQVEQEFTAMRARRAANVAGDGLVGVAIESESCEITGPGEALCTERFSISTGYGGKIEQSMLWDVTFSPDNGNILNYVQNGSAGGGAGVDAYGY